MASAVVSLVLVPLVKSVIAKISKMEDRIRELENKELLRTARDDALDKFLNK